MSNSKDFTGKVVIITGSTSGIGEGIAVYLSKLGAKVVITGRRGEDVKRVAKLCESVSPIKSLPLEVVADITNDEHAKRLIDTTIRTFGKLDVLVNNAGTSWMSSIESTDFMETYEKLMNLNLRSVVYLSHLSVPYLEKTKGNIVNISSIAAVKPLNGLSGYCMSKAALDMFTKCLAIELGPKAIRVNVIDVGPVESNINIVMGLSPEQSANMYETVKKSTLIGRIGKPHDIALLVTFLASNDASFITGSCILDDGGILLGQQISLPEEQEYKSNSY